MNEKALNDSNLEESEAKKTKQPISIRVAVWLFIILAVIAACSWGYSYLTNVAAYAGTDSSYTQWLIMQPIAGGGCVGENAPYSSLEAIDRAIGYEYIVKLPVKLIDGEAMIANDNPYALKAALERISGQTGVIIDIKPEQDNSSELSQKIYEEIKGYKGNIAVQSSNTEALSWFKDNADNIIRGISTGSLDDTDLNAFEKFLHRNMLLNYKALPYYIACDNEYLPNMIIADVNNDAYVIAQNIDNLEAAKKATEYSDNICIEGFSLY